MRRDRATPMRLSGHGAFDAVLRSARRLEGRYVVLMSAHKTEEAGRVGLIVGRRALARAVDRTRARRLLRAAAARARSVFETHDVILRLARGPGPQDWAQIPLEADRLLGTLVRPAGGGTR